jgi:hypothetical protein
LHSLFDQLESYLSMVSIPLVLPNYVRYIDTLSSPQTRELTNARDITKFKLMNDIDGKIQADYDLGFYHGASVQEEKALEMVEIVVESLKNLM